MCHTRCDRVRPDDIQAFLLHTLDQYITVTTRPHHLYLLKGCWGEHHRVIDLSSKNCHSLRGMS